VRGIIEGKGNVVADGAVPVNAAAQSAYEISRSGSHTLQSRDFEYTETLGPKLIKGTVEAIANGSGPRLPQSRLCS
jgi:hypothetical protein